MEGRHEINVKRKSLVKNGGQHGKLLVQGLFISSDYMRLINAEVIQRRERVHRQWAREKGRAFKTLNVLRYSSTREHQQNTATHLLGVFGDVTAAEVAWLRNNNPTNSCNTLSKASTFSAPVMPSRHILKSLPTCLHNRNKAKSSQSPSIFVHKRSYVVAPPESFNENIHGEFPTHQDLNAQKNWAHLLSRVSIHEPVGHDNDSHRGSSAGPHG